MEIKRHSFPIEIKELSEAGEFSAYGAVFGNEDSYGDVIQRGAFKKSLKAWRAQNKWPRMLWQHDATKPIGVYTSMGEDDHGLLIQGKFALDTQQGAEAYNLLKIGALDGFSIGFTIPKNGSIFQGDQRILKEIDLWEVSIVTFPANEMATLAEIKEGNITMSDDTNKVEQLQKAIEDLRQINEQRFAEAVKRGDEGASETREKLDKCNAEIEALRTELKEARLEAARSGHSPEAKAKEARAEFVKALRSQQAYDQMKAMSAGSGADGGYVVPTEIEMEIGETATVYSPMRDVARVVQISTGNYSKSVNVHGAVASWAAETDSRTATNTPQFASVNLGATVGELYALALQTQQLLDDAMFDVEGWLAQELALQFGIAEGTAFITGDGSSKPKGIAAYTTAATADASRAFGTLQHIATGASGAFRTLNAGTGASPVNDIVNAFHALKPQYRANAAWMMNATVLSKVRTWIDSTGRPLLLENYTAGTPPTILGRPVYEAPDVANEGANALVIAVGDFRAGYEIVDRIGLNILRDPFTNKPYVAFYATKRVGGAVIDSNAIKWIKQATS